MRNLYVHVPFCLRKCAYCAFYSVVADAATHVRYCAALAREAARLATPEPLDTIYFGGGTPGVLGAAGIQQLAKSIRETWDCSHVREWTVELHPATATDAMLDALRMCGVNRISMGAQSFHAPTLTAMGRGMTPAAICDSVARVRAAGIDDVGVDLIAGYPGVTRGVWHETLEAVRALNLCHVSVYALMVEQGTPLARLGLPPPEDDVVLAALADAEQLLTADGFVRYEISNYAKPGFACRHNLAVWRGEDYLGLGPAAYSRIATRRWANAPDVIAYCDARIPSRIDEEMLTPEDDALERVMFSFRLSEGVDLNVVAQRFPILASRIPAWCGRLNALVEQRILNAVGDVYTLTSRGMEVCDAVLETLL